VEGKDTTGCERKSRGKKDRDTLKKDLIEYIDFPDYIKIITRKDNWRDCFKEVFGSEETLRTKMQELEPIRNSVMHSRPITEEEKKKLELYAREITNVARSASAQYMN
jgi:hypothetical protein